MAYIGKEPAVGNFQVCDAISVVNGQAAYTMQVSSTNVVPESANHMLVSLNGILQKPNSSFTVSGSTITFASNLATGDVIDFIMLLGNVLDIGTPSDSTVTDAKTNFVSTSSAAGLQIKGDGTTDGTLQLNCSQNSHGIKLKSPAHSASQSYTLTFPTTSPSADTFLKTDGSGNLSFAAAGGITMADQWRLTTEFTGNANPIASNWERNDTAPALSYFGSQMTESSGVFSFPSTGIYFVIFHAQFSLNSNSKYSSAYINTTTNNSSYATAAGADSHISNNTSSTTYAYAHTDIIVDITDTSNQKVQFRVDHHDTNTATKGSSTYDQTFARFIRLGDT